MLDGRARSVAAILWVEVQLLGVLKGQAGSHLGHKWDELFWSPGSKMGEVGGILQHNGHNRQDKLQAQPPRWCRHCCPCLHGIHLVPSHLEVRFCHIISTFLIVSDITCDVIEASGGVQLGPTYPKLSHLSHKITPTARPGLQVQIPFPFLTRWRCYLRRQRYLLSRRGIDE